MRRGGKRTGATRVKRETRGCMKRAQERRRMSLRRKKKKLKKRLEAERSQGRMHLRLLERQSMNFTSGPLRTSRPSQSMRLH